MTYPTIIFELYLNTGRVNRFFGENPNIYLDWLLEFMGSLSLRLLLGKKNISNPYTTRNGSLQREILILIFQNEKSIRKTYTQILSWSFYRSLLEIICQF